MDRSRAGMRARWIGLVVIGWGAAVWGQGPAPSPEGGHAAAGECVVHTCRLVPEVKQIKKTVYEVQEVPYCLKKLPPLWSLWRRDCQEPCAECDCPRYRKVLVKKEVVCREICTTKCVVEEHRQPCGCPQCAPAPGHP